MIEQTQNTTVNEFIELWNGDIPVNEFSDALIEKNIKLKDKHNSYLFVDKSKKTEEIEANSVEEALAKTSMKDIQKIQYIGSKKRFLVDNSYFV